MVIIWSGYKEINLFMRKCLGEKLLRRSELNRYEYDKTNPDRIKKNETHT
jgi:hypothetical protein